MAHEDEAVKVEDKVESKLISEAQQRHEFADGDLATDQEKKQAAVEQAHALSTRPDGSYAQLHEGVRPTLAVADKGYKAELAEDAKTAEAIVTGNADVKVGESPAETAAAKKK